MWASAGQADSTAAGLVRGTDGGGRASGDTAASGNTASHGFGSWVVVVLRGEVRGGGGRRPMTKPRGGRPPPPPSLARPQDIQRVLRPEGEGRQGEKSSERRRAEGASTSERGGAGRRRGRRAAPSGLRCDAA